MNLYYTYLHILYVEMKHHRQRCWMGHGNNMDALRGGNCGKIKKKMFGQRFEYLIKIY